MKPLSTQNIESELSYAYLHAVAAHAGVGCKVGSRHDDSAGIDAELTGWGPFDNGGYLQEVSLNVQLKATIQPPSVTTKGLGYNFAGIQQYNDLRTDTVATPRILVVLFLPPEQEKWLEHCSDALTLRNCATALTGSVCVAHHHPTTTAARPFTFQKTSFLTPAD